MMPRILRLLLPVLLLAGCATSSQIDVLEQGALDEGFHITQVTVRNATSETFDIDIEEMLKSELIAEVAKRQLASSGGRPLALDVAIIQYEKGNAFKRWLMPGAGKTILSVEAMFNDAAGVAVAQSQATRTIGAGGGYTIGAWREVFDDVADQLLEDLVKAAAAP